MPVASGLSPVSPTSDLKLHGISLGLEDDGSTLSEFVKGVNREETANKDKKWVTREHSNKVAGSVETEENIIENVQVPSSDPVTANQADASNSSASSEDQVLHRQPSTSLGAESGFTTLCPDQVAGEKSGSLPAVDEGAAELQRMTKAATKLQACWRGFYTRNFHPRAKEVRYEIRLSRMQEHIICLTNEIEM